MPHTKQMRLSEAKEIAAKLKSLIGNSVTVILSDRKAVFGKVLGVANQRATIENLRRKRFQVTLTSITELYFDTVVPC